jgi:hypothetical protein
MKYLTLYIERFSNYIFPSTYERNNVSCDVDQNCQNDDTEINAVECKRINVYDEYKVCVCKTGWYLNPKSQKCGKNIYISMTCLIC